jgi:putative SOS response-associated peptidase YedK
MCNLYSQTLPRDAVIHYFRVSHNRAAAIRPKAAIFPGNDAPIVRMAEDGDRELVELSWGFVLLMKDKAPRRVTNVRDDKVLKSGFWRGSFEERRCLVAVTSFSEPKGRNPATWHWFALKGGETRPLFAFAGIWRRWKGPVKKDGESVEIDVFAFLTTTPNKLVATIHPTRMPVMLASQDAFDQWLEGTPDEAFGLVSSYPAGQMRIVQSGRDRKDNLGDAAAAE